MFQFWEACCDVERLSFCMEISEMVSKIKITYCEFKVNKFDNQKHCKWFYLMDLLFNQ